jgi:hypothetical protein
MAITADTVALAKGKLLGGAKVALSIPLSSFQGYQAGPQGGHGPLWELYAKLSPGGSVAFLFNTNGAMQTVTEYINSGVAFLRSGGYRPQ